MIRTKITELFGIQHPIIQGGMQHVSTPPMVIAVANGGGLGLLTCSNYSTKKDLVAAIKEIKSKTSNPFGLNIPTGATPEEFDMYLGAAVEEKIPVAETSGAKPDAVIGALKNAGIKVFHKIPTARFAAKLEKLGCDAIAVIGHEAGGHPGPFGVVGPIVLKEVMDTVKLPVIMGGGIYDGRGLIGALAMGAEAVLMATRFIASTEADVADSIKQWIVGSATTDTIMVKKENPNRVARSNAAYQVLGMEKSDKTQSQILEITTSMKGRDAWTGGDMSSRLHSMGQICGLIKDIKPCAEIIRDAVEMAEAIMSGELKKKFGS